MEKLVTCLLVLLVFTSVSGLPKFYQKALYEPGGLDHLDATGDESKWGKMVRWILTGKSNIPNEKKKAAIKGPDGLGIRRGGLDIRPGGPGFPDVIVKPNGRVKPVEAFLPDGSVKPAGVDFLIKPDGRIKPIGPFGPMRPRGPGIGQGGLDIRPGGPGYPDVIVKPNGRVKPVEAFLPDGSVKPAGVDFLIKPDGRIKPIGPFGPMRPRGLGIGQGGLDIRPGGPGFPDVIVKPNGRVKPVEAFLPDGSVKPAGVDFLIKPDGRIKPIGPFGPMRPDGSLIRHGVDVAIKPNGRIKPVAELIYNGAHIRPLGPGNADLVVVKPNGRIKPVVNIDPSMVAADPFESYPRPLGPVNPNLIVKPNGFVKPAGPAGLPLRPPGPYGYGRRDPGTDTEWFKRHEYGWRSRNRNPDPYRFIF